MDEDVKAGMEETLNATRPAAREPDDILPPKTPYPEPTTSTALGLVPAKFLDFRTTMSDYHSQLSEAYRKIDQIMSGAVARAEQAAASLEAKTKEQDNELKKYGV